MVNSSVSEDRARAERRSRMTVRVFHSHDEADRAEAEYWRGLTPAERLLCTWQLSEELWRLCGEFNDEPGLCRTVARVERR